MNVNMMPNVKWLCHVNFDNLGIVVKIPPKMQGSYIDDDNGTPKAMVESYKGVDDKPTLNIEGSHNTTIDKTININDIL
jgi:hypothetical protein